MDRQWEILEGNTANLRDRGEGGGFLSRGRKRKSKNDNVERNYICGCGKDYLSYPALYTHIKNKHNGIAPDGTELEAQQKPTQSSRKSDNYAVSVTSRNETHMNKREGEMEEEEIEQQDIVKKSKEVKVYKTSEIKLQSLELLEILQGKGVSVIDQFFTKVWNERDDNFLEHPIMIGVNKLRYSSNTELKTCCLVFSKFLIELSKIAGNEFFGMVVFILKALYDCLNLYGYVLLSTVEKGDSKLVITFKGKSNKDDFAEVENCEYIAMTFDFFVKKFLPSYFEDTDFEFDFINKFLISFNSWMYEYNLSKIEVDFDSVN